MELFIAAVIGLIIGSFLNVCIYRVPREMSVVFPARSFCPHCNKQLRSIDNIPVMSWIFLRGKCHQCKRAISGQYPLVELMSCAAALATALRFGINPTGIIVYILLATLIVITFIDLEFKIIPNVINFPGMAAGVLLGVIAEYYYPFSYPLTHGIVDSLIGLVAGSGFFYVVGLLYYLKTKRIGLGMGDVKLLAMTGAILGWQSIFTTIIVGSISGSIVGVIAMLINKTGRQTEIPFGPWLALGTVFYIFQTSRVFPF